MFSKNVKKNHNIWLRVYYKYIWSTIPKWGVQTKVSFPSSSGKTEGVSRKWILLTFKDKCNTMFWYLC